MRLRALALFFGMLICAPVQGIYYQWIGGTGSWNEPANWSTNLVPGDNTPDIEIVDIGYLDGSSSHALLNGFAASVDDLFIGAQATVTVDTGSLGIAHTIQNSGVIALDSLMTLGSSSPNFPEIPTMRGGGEIVFGDGRINVVSGHVLVNENNWIHGFGVIGGNSQATFENRQRVTADSSLERLRVELPTYNLGVLEATDFGVLELRSHVTNAETGLIKSSLGSIVEAFNISITGGTLDATEGTVSLGNTSLSDVSLQGVIDYAVALTLSGTIHNTGTLSGTQGPVIALADVTLSGGGSIVANGIFGGSGSSLVNLDNEVFIAGDLASEFVRNDGVIESARIVADAVENNGILRNVSTSTSSSFSPIENARGIIEIDAGNFTYLKVNQGIVFGDAVAGQIKPELDGDLTEVALEGIFVLIGGAFRNFMYGNAQLEIPLNRGIQLFQNPDGSPFELRGGGTLRLTGGAIEGLNESVRNLGQRITGFGTIDLEALGNANLIEAAGGLLEIDTDYDGNDPQFANSGEFRAVNNGQLVINRAFNTESGRVYAELGSEVIADSIEGGTIEGDGIIRTSLLMNTTNFATVIGISPDPQGGPVSLADHIVNHGVIRSFNQASILGEFVIEGTGEWQLSGAAYDLMQGSSTVGFVNGAGHTIRGFGQLTTGLMYPSSLALNHGTIHADSDHRLQMLVGGTMTNFGLLLTDASGGLELPEITNRGSIQIANSTLKAFRILNHIDGIVEGVGLIELAETFVQFDLTNLGCVSPGFDDPFSGRRVGELVIDGHLNLYQPGTLQIDLMNDGAGNTVHDFVRAGSAYLGSHLRLLPADGFVPNSYDTLTILRGDSGIFSTFDSIENVVLDTITGFAVTYDQTSVYLTAALLGDANLDGVVDVGDFNAWNSHKFGPAGWADGDFNGDGVADVLDFNLWNANKFQSSTEVVPEPEGWWSFLLVVVFMMLRRQSSR